MSGRVAVVLEPALVATLPTHHRLHEAAQNRANATAARLS